MGIRTIADLHHSRFGYDAMQMSQLQFDPSAPLVLGGDLGGTKTLLALAEAAGDGLRIVAERRYASRDHADFAALLADFLDGRPAVRAACFGLAGPTDGASARLTYLPWTLDADGLARRFGLGRVRLVNDFAAAAHGLAGLSDAQAPLRVGSLEIDQQAYVARVRDADGDATHPLPLTLTEYRLLTCLAAQPRRCFSRSELIEACLPESDALDRVIDSHLSKLRRKLLDGGCGNLIETVRGIGYQLWPKT